MRTTIDLDDDIAAAVRRLRRTGGLGLSAAVNQLARAGLRDRPDREPFRQRAVDIGVAIDVTDVAEALEILDGPTAR
ncbi:MAG: ribbon-helix-helix protein, CopG family [Candidatus Limnocylindrales bacterium]